MWSMSMQKRLHALTQLRWNRREPFMVELRCYSGVKLRGLPRSGLWVWVLREQTKKSWLAGLNVKVDWNWNWSRIVSVSASY
jgi:hypothetical protein